MRECRSCQESKPISDFRPLKGGVYHTRMCKPCLYAQAISCADRPEVKSVRRKRHYRTNTQKEKLNAKTWAKSNPQAKTSHNRARQKKLSTLVPLKQSDWEKVLAEQGSKCLRCGSPDITVDHIVPISKGGTNAKGNLQPLCSPCNSQKGVSTTDYRRQLS